MITIPTTLSASGPSSAVSQAPREAKFESCWADLPLKRVTHKNDDATRLRNLRVLIEFSHVLKDNKALLDFRKAWTQGVGACGGDAQTVEELESIISDTFRLPRWQMLQSLADLGMLERCALLQAKRMAAKSMAENGRDVDYPFTADELEREGRNWADTVFTSVGRIEGERLRKIDRETRALVDNIVNDPTLLKHIDDTNFIYFSQDELQEMLDKLARHMNAAHSACNPDSVYSPPLTVRFSHSDSEKELGSSEWRNGQPAVFVNRALLLDPARHGKGLRSLIMVLCHENFHISQRREVHLDISGIPGSYPSNHSEDFNCVASYPGLMLALSDTLAKEDYYAYRQGRETEREGNEAGMRSMLYLAQHEKLTGKRKSSALLRGIRFNRETDLSQGDNAIDIVRAALEKKFGFGIDQLAAVGAGWNMENWQSAAEYLQHERRAADSTQSSRIVKKILHALQNMYEHIDDSIRTNAVTLNLVRDALMMGAPEAFMKPSEEARFLVATLRNALSADSKEKFLDGMRAYFKGTDWPMDSFGSPLAHALLDLVR